jgi:hypothetical protein
MQEEFEDAKEVLRIRKSKKDRHIGAYYVVLNIIYKLYG